MKNLILAFLLFFTAFYCHAQKAKVLSGDTTFWGKLQDEKCGKLKLQNLISSTDNFHFRFWTDEQAMDIWTTDGITFNGMVTSYTNSYSYNEKKKVQKPSQTYSKQIYLDTAISRKAFDLTKHIAKIPTDKLINGWTQGFDGLEYVFETSTPTTYSFRTYWTPTSQDSSLAEAKMVQAFVNDLDSLLGLGHKYSAFFATLKPGPYIGDGPMITTKLTAKQAKYSKETKPYRDYLDSVKDTLNHYLRDTLTKIFARYGGLKCYDEFFLKFSKNNRLIKITTNSKFTDREDKKDFLSCKKKIAAAFKLINIDFVHSQVAYQKELTFSEGKINVFQ
jgi:hypothetical protein